MKLRAAGFVLSALAAVTVAATWFTGPVDPAPVQLQARPAVGGAPTEVAKGQDEEEGHRAREEWIELVHRAPDGVDWREVEADNVRRLIDRRRTGERAAPTFAWVERGSDNQAGSMYTVSRSADGSSLVAGAAAGGVWRGSLEGESWTPHGDGIYGGVHHLAVLPPDVAGGPDVMLTSPTWANLVYRSADDGATWVTPQGLPGSLAGVRRISVASDGTVWLVGVLDNSAKIYRSTDAGQTFADVLDLGGVWGDVFVPRTGDGAIYAVGDQLFVTTDNGGSWDDVPVPQGLWVARLAGSEATDPPRLYLAGSDDGYGPADLFVSTNGGGSWAPRGRLQDYWDVMSASIRNPELVAFGGVDMYRSVNGGQDFEAINTWDEYYDDPLNKLHADMMAFTVYPDGPGEETWYIGCHGGVYRSTDGLDRVRNLSMQGLRVSQYYSVHTSATDPTDVLAGSQDQGIQWADGAAAVGDGRFDFEQTLSGDYGHLVSTTGDHEWVYSVYPGFMLVWQGGNNPALSFVDFPSDPSPAPWLPYLTADPSDPEAVFFAGSRLFRYTHVGGDRWDVTQFSDQSFSQGNGEFLSAFEFSPLDPTLAWAVTSNGRVFRSVDGAESWNETDAQGPVGNWYYGAALVPSRRDPALVYLGGSGYDGPSVFRSTNGGRAFEPWSEGLPPTLVYTLVEARDGTGRVLAGTENAVYIRDPSAGEWVEITAGAPITQYWSAEVLLHENTVRFATYGRGLWDLRLSPQGEGCFSTVDADRDGTLCEFDCDDADPAAVPGGTEVCDGIDNDCDGVSEPDADGDGSFVCDEPPSDCDDDQPLAHPGLVEVVCDGIDNDCVDGELCIAIAGPSGEGCGCSSAPSSSAGLLAALTLLVSARRRRS